MADVIAARAAISWSGGKDSCLALLRAREAGLDVTTFLTMCDPDGNSKSHALRPSVLAAQVRALGGRRRPARSDGASYGSVFGEALDRLRREGHTHLVFGDIDLVAHREWLEPMARTHGLVAVFPLWGEPRAALAREVLRRGIRCRGVAIDERWLDASVCGAADDAAFLSRLPEGVCPAGEGGEFHTLVTGGPAFERPFAVVAGAIRRVPSRPPFAATTFARQDLLVEGRRVPSAGR